MSAFAYRAVRSVWGRCKTKEWGGGGEETKAASQVQADSPGFSCGYIPSIESCEFVLLLLVPDGALFEVVLVS